ncbi:MAG TPA: hypothetical protein VKP65_11600 [Rhodothermales bacterium]|nr:hypothetical protein [Rhodothermales bacterium]
MDKLVPIGRTLFAIALIGFGVENVRFGEFLPGRAPAWPAAVPGGLAWAYLTGTIFIGIGIAILTSKKARPAAILAGLLIFLGAFLRLVPSIAAEPFLSPAWTNAGKTLAYAGGAFAIAATLPALKGRRNPSLLKVVNLEGEFILVGRICLGLFLIIAGIQHFLYTEFVASLIPGWFPGNAVFWTYFAGVALIAGGTGLFIPQTARLAALLSGLMIFSWFFLVHISREIAGVGNGLVFGALLDASIAFVIAGYLYKRERTPASKHPAPSIIPITPTGS